MLFYFFEFISLWLHVQPLYYSLLFPSIQDDSVLPKGDLAHQFKPVVPWPHVEGMEVDLNSIRLKNGENQFHYK